MYISEVDLTSEINFFVSHGRPFRRFPPFRSPISKVPAFPVTHFEGSRLSGRPFGRFPPFRSPISKVPTFRSPVSKIPAFPVAHFEGSSVSFGLVKFEMMVKVFRLGASKRNDSLRLLIPGWDAERGICRLRYSKVKMVLLSSVFKFGKFRICETLYFFFWNWGFRGSPGWDNIGKRKCLGGYRLEILKIRNGPGLHVKHFEGETLQ
ncbi:unnamed protein product [Rhizophagus irregularis]|nr:unnamed protein product [Rhizophagus irregularis]